MEMAFNWKKTILITLDVAIAAYLLFAVSVLHTLDDKKMVCSKVKIDIKDDVMDGFLNANEIKVILQKRGIYPLAKPMKDIDVRQIEETLENSPFVNNAECHKTQSGHVCISLTQRMPVMRVKANNGDDYYIDNHGGLMPNIKYCSDIIIATGQISPRYAQKVLTRIGNYIASDKFWQNQIVQINVLNDGSMEIVPRVGDHIVYLGQPIHVQDKLTRLEKFYRYGLNKAGWNKYSYINMAFENQIICKKRNNI